MEADVDAGKRILFLGTPEAQMLTLRAALELRRSEVAAITPARTNFAERWVEVERENMLHGDLKGAPAG